MARIKNTLKYNSSTLVCKALLARVDTSKKPLRKRRFFEKSTLSKSASDVTNPSFICVICSSLQLAVFL